MDSSWRGIMEGSEGSVFVLNFIAVSHMYLCVCVYTLLKEQTSAGCVVLIPLLLVTLAGNRYFRLGVSASTYFDFIVLDDIPVVQETLNHTQS